MRFGLLALAALASALAPGWLQPLAIAALVLLFVVFPETGPALLAFLAPLFLVLVPVMGRPVNPAEAVAFLAALALVVRLVLSWTAKKRSHRPARAQATALAPRCVSFPSTGPSSPCWPRPCYPCSPR